MYLANSGECTPFCVVGTKIETDNATGLGKKKDEKRVLVPPQPVGLSSVKISDVFYFMSHESLEKGSNSQIV
jgi:hypothetical protein